MSIKFKQNGQWVKIPTPSQIDDTAASSATTYSSNKINEIIPQGVADYLAKHKDELGTDDFTKLKNVPFQLVYKTDDRFSSTDKMFPWTSEENSSPDKVVDDGVYYIAEDREFTINSCFDMVTFAKIQLGEIEESEVTSKLQTGKFNLRQGAIVLVGNFNAKIISPTDITFSSGYSSNTYTIDEITIAPMGPGQHTICVYYIDGLATTMQDLLYDLPYQNAIATAQNDGFSKGDLLVVQNDSTGSGSTPQLKFQSAGAQTTQITDITYKNYQKIEQWAKVDDGLYYVNTDKLSIELKGVDIKSQISTLFPVTEIDDYIDAEKGTQISVTSKKYGSQELGFQTQKLVNIYNTIDGKGYTYSLLFPDINTNTSAFVSLGDDLINTALSYSYLAANQLGEVLNTCITDESLRGKVPVISAPTGDTATGVKNVFKAIDFSSGAPITVITKATAANYNTLDKICHLEDGLYMCQDTITSPQDNVLDIAFKGVEKYNSYLAGESDPTSATIHCKSGALINVFTNKDSSSKVKTITISQSVDEGSGQYGCYYITANPDSGNGTADSPYVYGSTGANTIYHNEYNTFAYGMMGLRTLGAALGIGDVPTDGQYAQWKIENPGTSSETIKLVGVDAPTGSGSAIPTVEINDDNFDNYNTLEKWMNLDNGVYWFSSALTNSETPGLDETKKIAIVGKVQDGDNGYTVPDNSYIIPCPGSYVIVSKSNDTMSGKAYVKHILFYMNNGSNVSGGSDGAPNIGASMLEFTYDTRNTYNSEKVNCINHTQLLQNSLYVELIIKILESTIMHLDASADNGKLVQVQTSADSYTGFEFVGVDNPAVSIVEIPEATAEVTLSNNSDIRWLGTHSAISLKLPTEKTLNNYKCRVSFKKVNNELGTYTLTLPDDVTWRGDSIDSSTKKFKPETNTQYTIDFWNDGFGIKANVIQW